MKNRDVALSRNGKECMAHIKIKKGLNVPITGAPVQEIHEGNAVKRVALLGPDYVGLKPKLEVAVGDHVKLGQTLFIDKQHPRIRFTSPGAGQVVAIHRGEKRALLSVVIELDGEEGAISFKAFDEKALKTASRDAVVENLLASGLWTALRERPFSHVADPDTIPDAIFVTAMDTQPLAPDVARLIRNEETAFAHGLRVLQKLTEGKIYVCHAKGAALPDLDSEQIDPVVVEGPHPAGNVGTHIHFVFPVNLKHKVWHLSAQDVIAMGQLFQTASLRVERVIALAGSAVRQPRLVKTRLGADLSHLTENQLQDGDKRVISGSVLSGHTAQDAMGFLGRYHQQVSVLPEDTRRIFLGWLSLGWNLYSLKNIVLSKFVPGRKINFTPALHGGKRAIVPVGSYEKVMPLDMLPTYLLRALAVQDVEDAEKLGALELDEEDLALCTFVCPSKVDHGENLRKTLTLIEKEG